MYGSEKVNAALTLKRRSNLFYNHLDVDYLMDILTWLQVCSEITSDIITTFNVPQ